MFRFTDSINEPAQRTRVLFLLLVVLLAALAVPSGPRALAQGEPEVAQAESADAPTEIPWEVELTDRVRIISESRSGDVVTITKEYAPSADTFTTSGQPNTNWRNNPFLRVGYNINFGYGAERTFMAFRDLTDGADRIPANAVISDARLRIYLNEGSPVGSIEEIQARFLSTAWDPNLVTWNNYNPQWGDTIGIAGVPTTPGWLETSFINTVRKWVTGERPNYGVMFQANETPQQKERVFFASNSNNGLYPRLLVTYDFVVDTIPPTTVINPLPAFSQSSFKVQWLGTDNPGGTGVKDYDVQYRVQGGNWVDWMTATTLTENTFTGGANNAVYEFRARARDIAGNVGPWSAVVSTRVDTVPPNATVNALPQYTYQTSFEVTWKPNEDGANINHYDLQYQVNGGAWQILLERTTLSNYTFTNAQSGSTYGFRVRAMDKAGNVQAWSSIAQAATTVIAGKPTAQITPFSPLVTSSNTFNVSWSGTAVPGTTISSYEVQVSFNGGPFTTWSVFPASTLNAVYNAASDGIYTFRVRATTNLGQVGDYSNNPGSSKVVDARAPFITPRVYLPMVTR